MWVGRKGVYRRIAIGIRECRKDRWDMNRGQRSAHECGMAGV